MENYQSVKALKGKLNSDEVALNLKLDPTSTRSMDSQTVPWEPDGAMEQQESTGTAQTKRDKGTLLWKMPPMPSNWVKASKASTATRANNNGTDLSREQTIY